jgi:hypothetical protein
LPRRIDARELLAALGGLLVLISLFLEWYEPDASAVFRGNGITGWEAFEALDLVLAGLAFAVIATGAQAFGTVGGLGPRALLPLGALLTIIVVVQIASPPPVAWGADVAIGGWLALAGSLLVLAAGLLRAARIDVTVNVAARESRRRVAAVDRRPGTGAGAGAGSAAAPPAAGPPSDTGPAAARADRVLSGDEPAPAADPPARRSLLDEPDPQATQPFKPVDGER